MDTLYKLQFFPMVTPCFLYLSTSVGLYICIFKCFNTDFIKFFILYFFSCYKYKIIAKICWLFMCLAISYNVPLNFLQPSVYPIHLPNFQYNVLLRFNFFFSVSGSHEPIYKCTVVVFKDLSQFPKKPLH